MAKNLLVLYFFHVKNGMLLDINIIICTKYFFKKAFEKV